MNSFFVGHHIEIFRGYGKRIFRVKDKLNSSQHDRRYYLFLA
jgi:hypothetical protein